MEIDNALAEKGGQPSRPSSFLQKNDRSIYTFTRDIGIPIFDLTRVLRRRREEEIFRDARLWFWKQGEMILLLRECFFLCI